MVNTTHNSATTAVILRYAQRRGIPPEEIKEFTNPKIDLARYMLPAADKAAARLWTAINNNETVVIFGDYDADGITSTAILLRFLHSCTPLRPSRKLPNRKADQYGLDIAMAQKLVAEFSATLVICLDNGTNSGEAVAWLSQQGVDTLIIDHHPVTALAVDAVAILNPKAHPATASDDLAELCAAGLTLLWCAYMAKTWGCDARWDSATAIMLAGVGTLADAVAMSPTNRALAKNTLRLLNDPGTLRRCPGLEALVPADGQRVTQRRVQFDIVPPLNALGRLDSADPGVTLLLTDDREEARQIAEHCRKLNETRKAIQQKIVSDAVEQGRELLLRCPNLPVLVLAQSDWVPGVVGPAASRVAEHLERSAILLGPDGQLNQWKGSGRAHTADDLGSWLAAVKKLGCIERGGGHAAAVGVAGTTEQIKQLQSLAGCLAMPQLEDHEPQYEILGEFGELRPEEWLQVLDALEPCGRGNPFPLILARQACLTQEPAELRLANSGQAWASKGTFSIGGRTISAVWRDLEKAALLWRKGNRYDLEVELSAKAYNGIIYINWAVASCSLTVGTPQR